MASEWTHLIFKCEVWVLFFSDKRGYIGGELGRKKPELDGYHICFILNQKSCGMLVKFAVKSFVSGASWLSGGKNWSFWTKLTTKRKISFLARSSPKQYLLPRPKGATLSSFSNLIKSDLYHSFSAFFHLPSIIFDKPLWTKFFWAMKMIWIIHNVGQVGVENWARREGISFHRCWSCCLMWKWNWGNSCYSLNLIYCCHHKGELRHVWDLSTGVT